MFIVSPRRFEVRSFGAPSDRAAPGSDGVRPTQPFPPAAARRPDYPVAHVPQSVGVAPLHEPPRAGVELHYRFRRPSLHYNRVFARVRIPETAVARRP